VSDWQPIETAPNDGSEFQAWITSGEGTGCWESRCRFNEHGVFETWERVDYDEEGWASHGNFIDATHWQPQPLKPAEFAT